jgi:hypothetical protein
VIHGSAKELSRSLTREGTDVRKTDLGQRDFDMDPRDFKSLETEKLEEETNYGFKFEPSLILLMFLIICTAYVLTKLS